MDIDFLVYLVKLIAKCSRINITTNERNAHFYELVATHANGIGNSLNDTESE